MPSCPIRPDPKLNSPWTLENALLAVLLAVTVLSVVHHARASDTRLELVALEVPDGACLFLRAPGGGKYLLEATSGGTQEKGDPRLAERVVLPFLYFERALRLEGLLLSRPLAEHSGPAGQLLRELAVAHVWAPPGREDQPSLAQLVAEQKGLPVTPVERGCLLRLSPLATLEVLTPARPRFRGTADDPANNSCAWRLVYGALRVLVVPDLEAEGLRELAGSGQDLGCDILVAPREGTEEAACARLLAVARPGLIIASRASSGERKEPDSLAALAARFECKLVRTDIAGAVRLTTNGASWRLTTQAESRIQ